MVANPMLIWLPFTPMLGGGGRPISVKVSVSLSGGLPLSVTCTVTLLVLGTMLKPEFQVNRPLVGWMLAPAGAPDRMVKVSVWLNCESNALTVKLNGWPNTADFGPIGKMVGGVLPPASWFGVRGVVLTKLLVLFAPSG